VSAQAAGRGVKRKRNSADLAAPGESVVREFLQSRPAGADRLHQYNLPGPQQLSLLSKLVRDVFGVHHLIVDRKVVDCNFLTSLGEPTTVQDDVNFCH
jgi:hypothetical protein